MKHVGKILVCCACGLVAAGCAKPISESSELSTCEAPTLVSTPSLSDCTPAVAPMGAHTGDVLVSWTPNKEASVTSGGGYRIEYSTDPSFPVGSTTTVTAAGGASSQLLTGLAAGNYCIRITAYSVANPTGASSVTKVGVP